MIPSKYDFEPITYYRYDSDSPEQSEFRQLASKSDPTKFNIVYKGSFDLKYYLDRQPLDQEKNTHLQRERVLIMVTYRNQKPLNDIVVTEKAKYQKSMGKPIQYFFGRNKQRVMFQTRRRLVDYKYRAQVLDRYPLKDRPDFPFQKSLAQFCFPNGIQFHEVAEVPKAFSFILTDADANHTYTTVLTFDEQMSDALRTRIVPATKKDGVYFTSKAICIISRYCFMESFSAVLSQLYRLHLSQNLTTPLERFIQNIIEEIPLPDMGFLLVQHEIGSLVVPFYRPIDQYPPYSTRESIANTFNCLQVDDIIELFL
jgi:hypothetical protein